MESCKFEIRYTACSVDLSGKKVNHRFTFCTNSFESFASYYRYLRYGGVRRVSRVRSIRIGEIVLPFSYKTNRIKGVTKSQFFSWEAHLFNCM